MKSIKCTAKFKAEELKHVTKFSHRLVEIRKMTSMSEKEISTFE